MDIIIRYANQHDPRSYISSHQSPLLVVSTGFLYCLPVKVQCKLQCLWCLILQKYNEITAIENLETLLLLQTINLSGNKIRSLLGLHRHDVLEMIDLESNEVSSQNYKFPWSFTGWHWLSVFKVSINILIQKHILGD